MNDPTPPVRVNFVCTGNICRSPLAEAVFRAEAEKRGAGDRVSVDSSGLDAYHVGEQSDRRMRSVARRQGILIDHRSRRFHQGDFAECDVVVAMDTGHYRALRRMAPSEADSRKVVLFRSWDPVTGDHDFPDVPDPWYGGPEGFERVFEIVSRTCGRIADELT